MNNMAGCGRELNLDFQGGGHRTVTFHDLPFFVDQEFGEVPLDAIGEEPAFLRFEELVKGSCVFPVHLDLSIKNHISLTVNERLGVSRNT